MTDTRPMNVTRLILALLLPALLNYLLVYIDPHRRTLLDRWTGTRVVRIG